MNTNNLSLNKLRDNKVFDEAFLPLYNTNLQKLSVQPIEWSLLVSKFIYRYGTSKRSDEKISTTFQQPPLVKTQLRQYGSFCSVADKEENLKQEPVKLIRELKTP